jgi:hypothetical protein
MRRLDPQGLVAEYNPKQLLERPRCAALIGAIVGEAAHIDRVLLQLFGSLISGSRSFDPVAPVVFEEVTALDPRLELVAAVLARRHPGNLGLEFHKLKRKVRKGVGWRNRVAHAAWHLSEQYPEDLIAIEPAGDWTLCTAADLHRILQVVTTTRVKLQDFHVKVRGLGFGSPSSPVPESAGIAKG